MYLGFLSKKNGSRGAHVRKRLKEASVVMKQVWGICEKVLKDDIRTRFMMFESLVASVLSYGVEI